MLANWKNYHMPFQRLDVFTRHAPFPEEQKATLVDDGKGGRPKKTDRKLLLQALEKRWSDGMRR